MVGNIVDVGWATIKSGCLPITGCGIFRSGLSLGVPSLGLRFEVSGGWGCGFTGFSSRRYWVSGLGSKIVVFQFLVFQVCYSRFWCSRFGAPRFGIPGLVSQAFLSHILVSRSRTLFFEEFICPELTLNVGFAEVRLKSSCSVSVRFISSSPEAEFLDVIGKKVLWVFPPWYSQSPLLSDLLSPPPLQKWFEIGFQCNKHRIRKPQYWEYSSLCLETSVKLYVHEFGFSCLSCPWWKPCMNRSRIHERTISQTFLGIFLRVLGPGFPYTMFTFQTSFKPLFLKRGGGGTMR